MNIGIDIDDTINNLHEILIKKCIEFNEKQGIKHDIKTDEWNWDKAYGWDRELAKKFVEENIEEAYLNAPIKENAMQVINKLHTEGNKIIIITARGSEHCKNAYELSEKWLSQKNIKFNKLIVGAKDKAMYCVENEIDVFIDDHVEHCRAVSETNAKVFMFDSPYNKKETGFKRVYSWDEIYKEIKK